MRASILCLSCALGLLVSAGGNAVAGVDDYEAMIDQYLQQMGAEDYYMTPVNNQCVSCTFPTTVFYGVYFQQYPLGTVPPEGLAESNVFLMDTVSEDINYLTAPEDLLEFFQANWDPFVSVTDQQTALEEAAKTWLRLSVQLSQDGYYRFSPPLVEVYGRTAYGMIVVERGGEGYLSVAMTIGPTGTLSVKEVRHIRPGIRPL